MKKLYTIHDRVAFKHGPILVFCGDDEAKRSVRYAIKADDMMARCSHDFVLVCLGDIDEESLVVTPAYREVAVIAEVIANAD